MELNEIQNLIKFVAKSKVNEVEIEKDGFKIVIKTKGENQNVEPTIIQAQVPMAAPQMHAPVAVPAAAPVEAVPAANATEADDESKYITIKAPMIGTIYRKPSPEADAFVSVGDEVKEGQVICIIEAMKLFNEIESEVSGKIVKVLVEDNQPVQYDQPLFLVDPS